MPAEGLVRIFTENCPDLGFVPLYENDLFILTKGKLALKWTV